MAEKLAEENEVFVSEGAVASTPLTEEDCRALKSLAAYQLRYGETDEAIALLLVNRRLWPEDMDTLRLLAQALLKTGHTDAAETILDELDDLDPRAAKSDKPLLLRSVVLLRRMKMTEARKAFLQYLNRRRSKGGMHAR
ncbi:putative TPR domain-containing protein [Roseibium sp. TrichSKD4]|uniref:tetratricopeptide repeat protein n=1 Tax=Roseibium sp. TrichSKD4 TaxID=744980 RepID=UPI0001E5737E|nr:tetratricopeptide repeat protein [Roseibium sp. TrichSKD4]EFO28567.1 putative TPR domain-containing protein [Roseibium sp. TrichSKD4]